MKLRILALLAALLMGAAAPAIAQTAARAPSMAEEMEVQALLRGNQIQGRISIPDDRAATLIQPVGREWRDFHNYTLAWVGGIAVLGMVALLVVFRLKKGRIPIEGGPAGRTILRFNVLERANHWMVASCFIILGLSGLNLTFGRHILLPIVGPEAFTAISQWGKYAHNFLAFILKPAASMAGRRWCSGSRCWVARWWRFPAICWCSPSSSPMSRACSLATSSIACCQC
jgi:formate dehydrogenase subunit gamma